MEFIVPIFNDYANRNLKRSKKRKPIKQHCCIEQQKSKGEAKNKLINNKTQRQNGEKNSTSSSSTKYVIEVHRRYLVEFNGGAKTIRGVSLNYLTKTLSKAREGILV